MELEELHVLEREALAVDDPGSITGEGVSVRCDLEHLAVATGREHDRLGPEGMDLPGSDLVGDDPAADAVLDDEVEDEELVVELDALFVALLEQRLQDHVPGAVGRVAGSLDRRLTVIAGVTPETALVDLALGRAVEREPHALEIEHRLDRVLAHDIDGVLVGEEVTTLDGVERMPLPRVLLDVGECRTHSALRRAGVRTGGVHLRNDRGVTALARFERSPQSRTTRSDDDGVEDVYVVAHPPTAGSNVMTTAVPMIIRIAVTV